MVGNIKYIHQNLWLPAKENIKKFNNMMEENSKKMKWGKMGEKRNEAYQIIIWWDQDNKDHQNTGGPTKFYQFKTS